MIQSREKSHSNLRAQYQLHKRFFHSKRIKKIPKKFAGSKTMPIFAPADNEKEHNQLQHNET